MFVLIVVKTGDFEYNIESEEEVVHPLNKVILWRIKQIAKGSEE
mgnify:CR=1 FL=1